MRSDDERWKFHDPSKGLYIFTHSTSQGKKGEAELQTRSVNGESMMSKVYQIQ